MKRLFILIIPVIILCAGASFLLSIRPLAPTTNVAAFIPTATPSGADRAPLVNPAPESQGLVAVVTPTPTPGELAALTPQTQLDATLPSQGDEMTQTAVPAEQTLTAIDARSRATPRPTEGPSPAPRGIDMTTNILLMGTDMRPNDPTWQPATDVIMVFFLDTANDRAALLSIPRDLVVAIPHYGAFRINYVYEYGLRTHGPSGGAELVKQVLHDEFNIRIDHWALVDFTGFEKIIDTVGGIDLRVPCSLEDTIDQQHFVIPAGNVHMDYLTAKRYVQSRYTTSDTSRNFRQQRVMWAITKKALQLNALDKVPTLWDQIHDAVQTDMSVLDMVSLIPAAYTLELQSHPERVRATVLESPAIYPFVADYGAWLYMPDYVKIEQQLDNIFQAPEIAPTAAGPGECLHPASAPNESSVPTPTSPP